MHIEYDTRIERCKREDTKEMIITCLDNASIENHTQQINEFKDAMKSVGCIVAFLVIVVFIMHRVIK